MCIVITTAICFTYNGSPTQLILIANISTAVATPFGGFYVTRLIFRKDINEQNGMPQPRLMQFFMLVSYLFALVMTGSSLMRIFGIKL